MGDRHPVLTTKCPRLPQGCAFCHRFVLRATATPACTGPSVLVTKVRSTATAAADNRPVGETLAAWLENHAGREDVHAHQVLQTAKLVTPFTAAIAATFVATALQEEPQASPWDQGAVAAMVLALVGVLAVVFRARKTPDVQRILDKASNENWPDDRTVNELREELRRSAKDNTAQAAEVRWTMFAQVLVSAIASALAVVSILRG